MNHQAENTQTIGLVDEMRRSYLDYAMSVIVGRALPDARDGLKPVHRRALFSMHELGNDYNRPYKKSARIVGDVIGKYHPHGDSAVYDTIVRMAQNFSMRHMLVDGQGNFGSVDGDNAAAMRYTEVRLGKIAHELINDLDKNTVDYAPNYDGSEKEPTVLPAAFPNLLVNGATGIAVGMATSIPTHNLTEAINASLHLLFNPSATIDDLIVHMPAPDFPTGGIIYGLAGVHDGYRTGRGRVVMRAKTHFENIGRNGDRVAIVVDELPYQVNKKTLQERMAELVHDKRIEGISHIQDESDKSGMRLVIELKRGMNADVVLNNLYKQTQLQDTFGINMVALVDGKPQLCNLHTLISVFLDHRREVVTRRTVYDLADARKRAHTLEGYVVALSHLDTIIDIIRVNKTPADAKQTILGMKWLCPFKQEVKEDVFRPDNLDNGLGYQADGSYKFSETQVNEILQMRLSRLTGMEQEKIAADYSVVRAQILDYIDILSKPERVNQIIANELIKVRDEYGSGKVGQRRSLVVRNYVELGALDLIPDEEQIVTLTHQGYFKRQALDEYTVQHRGGRGKQATLTKEEDWVEHLFKVNTHDSLLCITNKGRAYWLKVWEVPEGQRQSRGRAIVNMFEFDEGEKITAIVAVSKHQQENHADYYVFMATSMGTVKKTSLSEFQSNRKAGVNAVNLDEGDFLIGAALSVKDHDIMLFSNEGKVVRFDEADVRAVGRNARGVRGMLLSPEARVISMLVVDDENKYVMTVAENGFGKRTLVKEHTRYSRGTRGMIAIQQSERNGKIVAATLVGENDEVMIISDSGVLVRLPVNQVRSMNRSTQGVTLISLDENAKVCGVERIADLDVEDELPSDKEPAKS